MNDTAGGTKIVPPRVEEQPQHTDQDEEVEPAEEVGGEPPADSGRVEREHRAEQAARGQRHPVGQSVTHRPSAK